MSNVFNRWTLCLIICLSVFLFSLSFFISGFDSNEFIVPPNDDSAIYGLNPAIDDELNYTVLSDPNIPFSFGLCANPVIDNGDLVVYFSNPSENDSWLLLRVYCDNSIVGSSGILKQGGFIERVQGDFDSASNIILKVLAYEPNMYYSNGTVSVEVEVSR